MATEPQNQKNRSIDGLSRREQKPEESFYRDFDESPKFLGFWVLVIFLLLAVFATAIYLAVYSKRAANFQGQEAGEEISEILLPFSDRVKDIKGDGQAILSFREKEFAKATGALEADFPLSNATFEIKKDSLYLKGRIKDSLIFWPLTFKISSEVKEQKFSFLLPTDDLQNVVISGKNKEKIELTFDKNLNQALTENNMIAEEIKAADGYIELHVIKEIE